MLQTLPHLLVLGLTWLASPSAWADPALPAPPEFAVLDEPNALDAKVKSTLQSILVEHDRLTDEQIVMALVRLPEKTDLEGYTQQLFTHWQVGQRGKGLGLLVVADISAGRASFAAGHGMTAVIDAERIGDIVQDHSRRWLLRDQPERALVETAIAILRALESPLVETGELDAIRKSLPAFQEPASDEAPVPFWIWAPLMLFGVGAGFLIYRMVAEADAHYTGAGWSRTRPTHLWRMAWNKRRRSSDARPAIGGAHGRW